MAAPAFGSAGTYLAGTASTMSVAVPSGVASGDIIVVFAYVDSTATITAMPSGFAQATGSPQSVTNQAHRLYVMWKRATGADTGTYDFTPSTSIYREAVAVRYTGAVTSGDPWDVVNAAAQNRDVGTTTPAVSVTTTGPDRLLVFAATYWAGGAWTPPSGFTERVDNSGEFTVDDLVQTSAGSSGNVSTTVASSTFSTTAWLGALSPPSGSTANGTASPTGAGSLTAAASVRVPGTAALAAAGTLSTGATVRVPGAAAPAGAGSLTATATARAPGTASLTSAGALTAAGTVIRLGTATLTGAGTLTALSGSAASGTGVLTAAWSLTVTALVRVPGAAALVGAGSLAAATSSRIVYRPDTGTVARPDTGTVTRPYTGIVVQP